MCSRLKDTKQQPGLVRLTSFAGAALLAFVVTRRAITRCRPDLDQPL